MADEIALDRGRPIQVKTFSAKPLFKDRRDLENPRIREDGLGVGRERQRVDLAAMTRVLAA